MASLLRITHVRGRLAPAVEHFAVQRLTIGSAPGSDLYFGANEGPPIAPSHAEIRAEQGGWVLLDMGAPVGTFVNAVRVASGRLQSGDVVRLGPDGPEFRVDLVESASAGPDSSGAVPSSEGGVDLATAQRMIADAIARDAAGGPDSRAAAIVTTKLEAARRRSSRNNILLALGLGVTIVALIGTGALVWDSHRRASQLTSEAGIGKGGNTRPKGQIPTKVLTGREIFEESRAAVYLMGWRSGTTVGGSCTAFAIKPDVLATNAHCINALKQKGGTPIVTLNESGGKTRFKILGWSVHPKYKAGKTSADAPDVGLLRIDGKAPKLVTLANDAELHALGPGDDLFVIGFPGRVMDPVSPSATFLQGHLGRVMALGENAPEGPDDAVLLQHDAVTRGGNSGSPMFNQYGDVVAIHAAHLDDEADVKVDGKQTTVVNASPYRVGMRIDLLKAVPAP